MTGTAVLKNCSSYLKSTKIKLTKNTIIQELLELLINSIARAEIYLWESAPGNILDFYKKFIKNLIVIKMCLKCEWSV